jgi:hypothetical protein
VGAYLNDHAGGVDAGAAYVFVGNGSSWSQAEKLVGSDATDSDWFGYSVAIDGETVLVGSPMYDLVPGTIFSGAVYVFVRTDTGWSEQTRLMASDAMAGDFFGASVSISGDTAVIGALAESNAGGPAAGSAYVFVRNGTTWSKEAKLVASDAAGSDQLGWSVSISGDTVLAGSVGWDQAGLSEVGAAYIFVRSGSAWSEQAILVASDAAEGDLFGGAVSLSGESAVIGVEQDSHAGGPFAGSAYVFVRSGSTWSEQAKLVASDAGRQDRFGRSASIFGETIVVGSLGDDSDQGHDVGAAYVFTRSRSVWSERAKLVASDAAAGDALGWSVSNSAESALVGAVFDDLPPGGNEGSAYVYCVEEASASSRNAGANPASYTASAPVLGAIFTGTVDLTTTGHAMALLFGFDSPFTFTFPGGQVLLCLDLGGSGELLGSSPVAGPSAVISLTLPSDPSLCGFTLSTQALHLGGIVPFALSNAQDLVVGAF